MALETVPGVHFPSEVAADTVREDIVRARTENSPVDLDMAYLEGQHRIIR